MLTSTIWGFGSDDTAHDILTAFEYGFLKAYPASSLSEIDNACTLFCESVSAKDGDVPKNARSRPADLSIVHSYLSRLRNVEAVSFACLPNARRLCDIQKDLKSFRQQGAEIFRRHATMLVSKGYKDFAWFLKLTGTLLSQDLDRDQLYDFLHIVTDAYNLLCSTNHACYSFGLEEQKKRESQALEDIREIEARQSGHAVEQTLALICYYFFLEHHYFAYLKRHRDCGLSAVTELGHILHKSGDHRVAVLFHQYRHLLLRMECTRDEKAPLDPSWENRQHITDLQLHQLEAALVPKDATHAKVSTLAATSSHRV